MKIKGYGWSVIGGREMNQDNFLIDNDAQLFAVADGVGGGLNGDVASRMAVDGLKKHHNKDERLKLAIEKVQTEVLNEALTTIGEALMGTTLTTVRISPDLKVEMAHVGDSHCYLYHQEFLQIKNEDHEAFDESMGGPVLNSYLGLDPDILPLKIQEDTFVMQPTDRILLCTDGLYKQISDLDLLQILKDNAADPQKLVETLCTKASEYEYSDNITVVWIVPEP